MASTRPTSRGAGRGTAATAAPADVDKPLPHARAQPRRIETSGGASTIDRPRGLAQSAGGVMKVLVIDVGGTTVKVLATGQRQPRRIPSGPTMTAEEMVAGVKPLVADWKYDVVSIGYPGAVIGGRPLHEPMNLGGGWVRFDFSEAFGCPVKLINDAAMQALERRWVRSAGAATWRRSWSSSRRPWSSTTSSSAEGMPRNSGNYHRAPVSALTPMPSSADFGSGRISRCVERTIEAIFSPAQRGVDSIRTRT